MAIGDKAVASAGDAKPRFLADPDEATYWQRVKKTWDMLDFRTAFATSQQVQDAKSIVWRAKNGAPISDEAKYQAALHLTRAVLHPDTGDTVIFPLRVSMIVPMNLGLDCGMILASTTRSTIFWQWLNQTYNALHYYANRNATNQDTTSQRIAAYIGATASSVAASLGVRRWAKAHQNPLMLRFAPFAAVATADLLNLAVMRQSEYLRGVNIFDETGEWVGVSKACGLYAVASCIGGRIFAAAPILIIPPLIIQRLETKTMAFRTRPWLKLPATLALVAVMIQTSVPLTFGLFRQSAQVDTRYIENDFRHRVNAKGVIMQTVTYNKGI
ncbi:hypothetical protein H310_09485 [Aphanomyces invadans]|uniref:Sidoreflexin n=2 Tax=Aphanomyces invadans TaxID=157072 RepID=A0A024TUB7_9STRA|nr:hypothetical protein H310_09485 [Aphanomyces invadans]ETV97589.1 hypothetical protein H310_09485 [Aphanomyces invadans]|eukprot:XP_008873798.1 hypothetical protein H310_09485 [Aphanomyces invadans]